MNSLNRPKLKISEFGLVIVTGGSSGIGKTIIERVMKLDSRPRLCNLSRQKPDLFFIDSQDLHLECDLRDKDGRAKAINALQKLLRESPDIGPVLLINNAGSGLYGNISEHSAGAHLDLIEVNLSACVDLTASLLPYMTAIGGAIMNIASTASFQATPGLATYGAAKAFLLNWTLALNEELKHTSVRALAICPGATRTHFFERAGIETQNLPPKGFQTADQVVDTAFNALAKGKAYVTSGFLNKLMVQISFRLPKTLGTLISGSIIRRNRRKT